MNQCNLHLSLHVESIKCPPGSNHSSYIGGAKALGLEANRDPLKRGRSQTSNSGVPIDMKMFFIASGQGGRSCYERGHIIVENGRLICEKQEINLENKSE